MLLTTHYMDEADKLCDRIAIVDHGKLVALGTPVELKNSVAGANVVEVHFDRDDEAWPATAGGDGRRDQRASRRARDSTASSPSRDRRPPCRLWSWRRAWVRRSLR